MCAVLKDRVDVSEVDAFVSFGTVPTVIAKMAVITLMKSYRLQAFLRQNEAAATSVDR